MDLYNEKINEFTDWVSGENSLTGGNDTSNLPVSGRRIRELLQEKLKKPIFIYRDTNAHLYRVFSSSDAYRAWEKDPVLYKDLEITNFVAPSEYGIEISITSGRESYVRYGIEGQSGAEIRYTWEVKNDKNQTLDEVVNVTYEIAENGYHDIRRLDPSNKSVIIDMTPHLSLGTNTIKMSFKGTTSGAETSQTVYITAVQLNVGTDLEYTILQKNLSQLQFGMYANRNIKGPLSFKTCRYYYGNNTLEEGAQETVNSTFNISSAEENNLTPSASYRESGTSDLLDMKAGLHSVQVWGQMSINNNIFYSNLIYYIINVAYAQGGELKIDGISLKYDLNDRISLVGATEFQMIATQYEQFSFDWGYIRYVDQKQNDISWYLRDVNEQDSTDVVETFINTYRCTPNTNAPTFTFTPSDYTRIGRKMYLVAYRANSEIIEIPIQINKSSLTINETTGIDLRLKLSAYGRQNDSYTVDEWDYGEYSTTFTGVKWNSANGWYENSLRLSGENSHAVINYNPFYNINAETKGVTVEIDFESEYVSSTDEELIRLGGTIASDPHISIFANRASLYISNTPIITTNYKANERVKLAFIVEPRTAQDVSEDMRNVIFIVNNGIVERAAGWKDYNPSVFNSNAGNIKIGGINSGIRVYGMRCYSKAITISNAYDNFVYDSDNKKNIIIKNNIYKSGVIDQDLCANLSDIIIIKGNLSYVLDRDTTKEGSNVACDIQRINLKDSTKDFTVTHGRIRKHGQSTLNYPLTSYKLWTWSSVDETRPTMIINTSSDIPFTKNRYQMKDNAIPANKFVLQANYADSSGTHNGGFLRLIQDTWFNAKVYNEYKLRTPPQLFTTNQVISLQDGDNNSSEEVNNIFRGYNTEGKQWKDYFGDTPFPYTIRNAPDSFPCLVFYQNLDKGETAPSFLGQYVFMDDKKSDYTYGQRSIYKVVDSKNGTNNAQDPFCVKRDQEGNSLWDEDNGSKIWDNDKVLRLECLSVNSTLADFRGYVADNSKRRYDDFVNGQTEESTTIGWEEDFELVYPEKEEITASKRFSPEKFRQTVQPFTDWLGWLISTYQNQSKFEAEAPQHLDLYKIAAYYIFVLRFGLVDSLERNAQIKTYDGQHFHYEPWDMDIALGNRNTGGIAFDPPIDRNTMMDADTAAISGKSRIDTNNDKIADTTVSNWLFDALEAWPYWMETIVPKVADALYEAGLKYENVIDMLDNEYQNEWSESIYNESGLFKYVKNRQNTDDDGNILPGFNDDWLAWLQGARTTHRHWWLKTSMDYYDAKWGVGEFKKKSMYFGCEMHNVNGTIDITPYADTYFSFEREATKFGPYSASITNPLRFDMSVINSGAKVPFKIYGANFIREIDISSIAAGLQVFSTTNSYSSEVGPTITKVNIGVPISLETSSRLEGSENNKSVTIEAGNSMNALEELNIRGQKGIKGLSFLENVKTITKLNAAGSGLLTLTSAVGTDYDTLELPNTLTSITFNSTTWNPNKLSFWTSIPGTVTTHTYQQEVTDEQGNVVYEEDGITPVMEDYTVEEITSAAYNKYTINSAEINTAIPRSLLSVSFKGTTGKYACARQFITDWIYSIISWGTEDWNNHIEATQGYNSLEEYIDSLFRERTLQVENIYWDNESIPGLSYTELEYISKFNNIDYTITYQTHPNVTNFAKGYVMITNAEPLTGIQTSYLSTWFGTDAFTLNSGGLVIDQALDYTAITVGQDAYVVNREIYLKEGTSARISATRFRLQSSFAETQFSLAAPDSQMSSDSYIYPAGSGNVACSITATQLGEDFIYYLKTYPNVTGQDYDVKLMSGSGSVIVHIKALDYPQEIFLSVNGDLKTSDSGSSVSAYRYFKDADVFVIGKQTGNQLFGIQFKEDNKYVNNPKKTPVQYVKFKLYKDGQLCSAFDGGLDYTTFTTGNTIEHPFVDSSVTELSYTTGYKTTDDKYKYFIPLYVQNNVTTTPTKYTLTADIKIGGMVTTLSQDFVLVQDSVVAQEGTALWGLINAAYVEQFSVNFNTSFYKSICCLLTGTISVNGQYNSNANWITVSNVPDQLQTLIYNNNSILKSLPNITGINLDGASYLTSTYEGITNIDLSNVRDLRTFSIQNCSGITGDIDLSGYTNLQQVDTSGVTCNVIIPDNAPITKYELGTPTAVRIVNPTQLNYTAVKVDDSTNINSIDLVNIPNSRSFSTFTKIMNL